MDNHYPNYSTSKSKEEYNSEETFLNPLPRAVMRRNSPVLLDGEWNFAVDTNNEGLQQNWYLGHTYKDTIQWPGSIEAHIIAAKGKKDSHAWKDTVIAWYEREFPLPEIENGDGKHNMLQLTFGACGYETQAWLNGLPLTTIEGEKVHIGEYTSFSYELPDEILKPVNRLTVRIAATMDADIPRGKQESFVYKRGGIWYQTYTGAVRSIWLEPVERNRLRSRVGVVSVVEDSLVRFNFTTRIHDPGLYTLRLKVYHRKQEEPPLATADFRLPLEAGQKQQRVDMKIPEAILWSPENPHLYRLVAILINEQGYEAEIETRFGIRKVEARGAYVYLNNISIYLDGILYQPGTSTFEQVKRHMHAMKALGCNLVRIHIAGVDPRIYNLADKLGMLLWVEVPSPHSSNHRSRANHKDELLRMLALIGTHPSVIIWSLYNEDWGAQDIATNAETRQYITDMYHFMKVAHPQFLVVDNDGWQHVSVEGELKSDLMTVHLYTPDLKRWRRMLEQLAAGEMVGVAAFPLVVGDPFFFKNQAPLIVSEWGGFGFKNYGGPKDNSERSAIIQEFKKELRRHNIAGDVYTQATNIEDEKNGLIDFETGDLKVSGGLLKSHRPSNEAFDYAQLN